ncbi:hypothetical protein AMATHDRAFT_50317 [Amanita thiersii Skay4041]|uniref:Uncharacterized protein n=1 Tax=Amanita thiersii Skay4041 TaxID=703135 RepID=A0A2A9NIC2_9AGAR|nr:hypothetical protein AMATHDRAFT_50317 [Amanita thiersii Skay4041]
MFPAILWFGGIACLLLQLVWSLSTLNPHAPRTAFLNADVVQNGFLSCTIGINIYATTAIILRIWWVVKKKSSDSARGLRFIIRVVADSGLLYTLTAIVYLITWLIEEVATDSPHQIAEMIGTAINIPMIGIAFNLILIRVAQQRARMELILHSTNQVPSMRFLDVTGTPDKQRV